MAVPEVHVRPYWELTFDADGDPDPARRDRLLREVPERGVRDLVVFAHGWNNDRSIATRLYDRFFAPFPALAPGAHLGYVGVLWPSMRFTDEPIPDFDPSAAPAATAPRATLDKGTRQALHEVFAGQDSVVDRLAGLLDERPDRQGVFDEFGGLVAQLVGTPAVAPEADADTDADDADERHAAPAMFRKDTRGVCLEFAAALEEAAQGVASFHWPGGVAKAWQGAHELLRQATYFAMKKRAGKVGKEGLGPALGRLAHDAPDVRVHLVGHSFGARLVSFALAGLPAQARNVKSVTLLQGAFSHYAFAPQGTLRGQQARIDGPLVSCYSHFDTALSVMYPLASRLAGEDRDIAGLGMRWGAMGFDGIQSVTGAVRPSLAEVLRTGVPASGCVSVDSAQVVRHGPPPAGAHSDICHEELARVVLGAGRVPH
ncbi:serine-threonine protein kinase [Streptomyces longispororuber]|uniref:serine-threonine protein kinase n=1 Tax=Streptomyces longispororuber TaxID=68230 RepID=UPI00210C2317|nr:serine-threonine protein kinase [Streptomyces longispororuber]MCQ4208979.1 serine-threonine protein kinase [Streptomyces longispororuber]